MFYNYKNFQVPDFDIRDPLKKKVPYTVIPIGNKEDLLRWRKEQILLAEARDAYLKPIRQATRDRVVAMVANQNAEIKADAVSLAELAHVKARAGVKVPKTINTPPPVCVLEEEEKPSLMDKAKGALKALWDATGFYK